MLNRFFHNCCKRLLLNFIYINFIKLFILYNESCQIISALGGLENIETVSACATRLRVSLKDNILVNDDVFKMLGAPGVLKVAGGVQAIFGGKADLYSQEINDIIAHPNMQPANNPQNDVYSVTTK